MTFPFSFSNNQIQPLNPHIDQPSGYRPSRSAYTTGGIRDRLHNFLNGVHQTKALAKARAIEPHLRSPTQQRAVLFRDAIVANLNKSIQPKIGDQPIKGNPQLVKAYPNRGSHEIVPVFRGLKSNTAGTRINFNDSGHAVSGKITARGSDTDAYAHNIQGNQDNSALISYTTDPRVATEFAGREGYVAVTYIENGSLIASPDSHGEQEVLVLGNAHANALFSPTEGVPGLSTEELEQALQVADRYEQEHGIAENDDFIFVAY